MPDELVLGVSDQELNESYQRAVLFAKRKLRPYGRADLAEDFVHTALMKAMDGSRPWDPSGPWRLYPHLAGVVRGLIWNYFGPRRPSGVEPPEGNGPSVPPLAGGEADHTTDYLKFVDSHGKSDVSALARIILAEDERPARPELAKRLGLTLTQLDRRLASLRKMTTAYLEL